MTSKHSPGPWSFQDHGSLILDARSGSSQTLVAKVEVSTYRDEGRYNARLIAAAPSYHEAVQAIYEACESNAAPVNLMAALREMDIQGDRITLDADLLIALFDAHSKATGESQ